MEGRLLLKNCAVFRSDGRIRENVAIVVVGGKIAQVAPDAEVPVLPGDWEIACRGRLVTAGLVDCHTHLVGGQLVPFSGEALLRPPAVRLERQRHLDALLTPTETEVLARVAIARALRSGVTLAVEHLHSPQDSRAGLSAVARAARALGIRLAVSHATTSLEGPTPAQAQLDGNLAFADEVRGDPLVRAALGFHASFTSDDALLGAIGKARADRGLGVHYHLAESEEDLTTTFARYGMRVVPRLEGFGLLGPGVVASLARAIDRTESARLLRERTLVALSPRWGLSAEPGGGGFEAVFSHQNLIGLGTSGAGTLWDELLGAFIGIIHIARNGRLLDPDGFLAQLLIGGPAELCSYLYGAPSGGIAAGSLADLIVLDHVPAHGGDSLAPHLLLQLGGARVSWSVVGGRVVMREGQLLGHDHLELEAEAAKVLASLWARAKLS